MLSQNVMEILKTSQQGEVTEALVYRGIAGFVKNDADRKVLLQIADEEESHGRIWQSYTHVEMKPEMRKVHWYTFLARTLGYTFAIKRMENGEAGAQVRYADAQLNAEVPEAKKIRADENHHEAELIGILDEEKLHYVGSIVLGLNDALVEISGSLAGFTLAYRNTRMTALAGLITGIAATFSMAASEYLSARSEGDENAAKSCLYTGAAYMVTVALLVLPYLILPTESYIAALVIMLITVLLIIAVFNYYISVAKSYSFKKRFFEMAGISMGVAALSFVIGILVKQLLGIDI